MNTQQYCDGSNNDLTHSHTSTPSHLFLNCNAIKPLKRAFPCSLHCTIFDYLFFLPFVGTFSFAPVTPLSANKIYIYPQIGRFFRKIYFCLHGCDPFYMKSCFPYISVEGKERVRILFF